MPTSIATIVGSCILGISIIIAAIAMKDTKSHAVHRGVVQGDIVVRLDDKTTATNNCEGCVVDLYPECVIVHIDPKKCRNWTVAFQMVIPWSKVEHLSLQADGSSPSSPDRPASSTL